MKIIAFRVFRLKTISFGGSPRVFVICELYANKNTFTSAVDYSVYLISLRFMIHLMCSCRERFIHSTRP